MQLNVCSRLIKNLRRPAYIVGITLLTLSAHSAFAAVSCPAGFTSDEFSNSDYTNLAPVVSPPTPQSNQNVIGIKSESYLIASNSLTTSGTLDTGGINRYQSDTTGGVQVFRFYQDFADKTSTRTASYTFSNKFSNQPQALTNVGISIYDIDTSYVGTDFAGNRYFEFFDQATVTGVTSAGTTISPVLQSKGAGITSIAPYRQTNLTSSVSCGGLNDNCRVSLSFNQPVVKVDITYGNNTDLNYFDQSDDDGDGNQFNDPGDQLVDIRFDGYCYQPQPRLIYTKALSDPRIIDTDEFRIQITDNANNTSVTSGISTTTTAGEGNTVTTGTGTTGTFRVDPTKTYTLTEIASGTTNLSNYNATYTCRRSDGTTVTTLNPNSLKLTYGDNWTCTITNSRSFIFSGIVFNDNGGITASSADRQNISSTFIGNGSYFNGTFDSATESGIYDNNLQVRLTNCNGTNIATTSPNPQTVSNDNATRGRYNFIVPASALANSTRVCVVENEPSAWDFTIDTTPDTREVTLVANVFEYKTERNSAGAITRNLDFGEVRAANAALVLIKSQYVHDCNASLNYQNVGSSENPTQGFSTNPISNIESGRCIAYRIQAFNRGHIALQQVRISDELQSDPVASVFKRPAPLFIPTSVASPTVAYDTNGTIQSNLFSLTATSTTASVPPSARLFFNTKFGTTQSN
ncbi:hypothetical protein [Psychrobacter sp. DM4]|uniref:hypothetical protein n=1 Tax=Psychrobacter sp. DM4 TaxID=3440637 RepID=UPI003F50876E